MPRIVRHGYPVAEGLAMGLQGAAIAGAQEAALQSAQAEKDRQFELDERALAGREAQQQAQLELDQQAVGARHRAIDIEEQQLNEQLENRKEMAARIQVLADRGLFGEQGEQVAAVIPGIVSGDTDPEKIMKLVTQAQEDAKRTALIGRKMDAAVQEIGQYAAQMPHDEEIQELLVDVETGVVDPDEGRALAAMKAQNLGPVFERMVQARVAEVLGSTPLGPAPGVAANVLMESRNALGAAGLKQAQERIGRTAAPIASLDPRVRQEVIGRMVDAKNSPLLARQIAVEAGIDTTDQGLIDAMEAESIRRERSAERESERQRGVVARLRARVKADVKRFPKKPASWHAERLRATATSNDTTYQVETGDLYLPDITDDEIAALLRQAGLEVQ